jgi:hypothetical protein
MYITRRFVALVIIAVAFFAYASYQPRFRLRAEMPEEFMDASSSAPAQKQATEARIARAYWRCMVTEVQWNYRYGRLLPPEPPPEFMVATQELGSVTAAPATRARYWRKVRQVWYLPGAWSKDYVWDTAWVRQSVQSVGTWLDARLHRVTDMPQP